MKKGLLIILSGPSGVGKGTVREKLFEDATLNLAYSISMTTRSPRPGEKNGREYFFVTKEEFEKKIEEGGLLEHAQFVGNYYGRPKAYVDQLLSEGKNVLQFSQCSDRKYGRRRTEEENIVQERLNKAAKEIATKDNYKHVVVNNTVEQAASEIAEIIKENIAQH